MWMFRRGVIVPLFFAALPVVAAAWVFSPSILEHLQPPPETATSTPQQSAIEIPDLEGLTPRSEISQNALGFDVARISPDGVSVFAGQAPPNSLVTVTVDGKPVGTTKADERGEWTLITEKPITSPDPILGLSTKSGDALQVAGNAAHFGGYDNKRSETKSAATSSSSARIMREFEDLVAEARKAEQRANSQSPARAPVPIPIQFVYREAVFTEQGRKAAELLVEYLKLTKPESIVLTGHADERGSDEFNLELSRQRLQTVASFLRENGFEGRLKLIPKGRSEPYRGVDRSKLDRETLWQLDRRVELVLGDVPPPQRSVQVRN